MSGELTIHELLQTPVVTGVISQFKTPLSRFQNFYNLQVGGTAGRNISGRNIGWDVFNTTRTIAQVRAPGVGPGTVTQKPVGHVSAQAIRMHEKIVLHQEYISRTRVPGQQIGTLDATGQAYVKRQLMFGTQRFRNAREYIVSRMFRGGFGVRVDGDTWYLTEITDSSATFTVDFQIPAANKDYLELGSGSNIIQAPWDDPGCPVISQILAINRAYERMHGWPLRHIWINSETLGWLFNNIELQAVGGSAYRIFDSLKGTDLSSAEGRPDTGVDVVFRALPTVTFHIYDGVLVPTGATNTDGMTTSDVSLLVPKGKAIFTPDPSAEWCYLINGSEYVAENVMDEGKEVFGFHNWTTRVIDPAGWELKLLDNCLPALALPNTICYGTIGPTS